jgi:hypothetical protein
LALAGGLANQTVKPGRAVSEGASWSTTSERIPADSPRAGSSDRFQAHETAKGLAI